MPDGGSLWANPPQSSMSSSIGSYSLETHSIDFAPTDEI